MRTVVVGQIHDSIVLDCYDPELPDVLEKLKQTMTVDIRKSWSWIIVPLAIEAEVGRRNWFEKEAVAI